MANIDKTLKKVAQHHEERKATEIIADLRTELHEIYKREQQGQDTPRDSERADDIAFQIHELSVGL